MYGIEAWEVAVPGIKFQLAYYESGTIYDKIEILKDTCPVCKFVNTRVLVITDDGAEIYQVPSSCQKQYLQGSPWHPNLGYARVRRCEASIVKKQLIYHIVVVS